MPFGCAVAECQNGKKAKLLRGSGLLFHRFPKNIELRATWVSKCKRADKFNVENSTICSDHFRKEDYQRDFINELLNCTPVLRLKDTAVPNVFTFRELGGTDKISLRELRVQNREKHQLIKSILQPCSTLEITDDNKENSGHGCTEEESTLVNDNIETASTGEASSSCYDCLNCRKADETIANLEAMLRASEYRLSCHKSEILRLQSCLQSMKLKMKKMESRILTPQVSLSRAQQEKLNGSRKVKWASDDIVQALSIRSVSLKAYKAIRAHLQVPLPAERTLRKWTKRLTCDEGILEEALEAIKVAVSDMDPFSRLSVLSFDEMSIDSTPVIDPTFGNISSHSRVQVMLLKGLCAKWKQPVFYKFDQKVTKEILFHVITRVEQTGLKICATVCDLGPDNQALLKNLEISAESTWFANPFDPSRKVYVFADIPHCLKNLRNHILDHGAVLPHDTIIDKDILRQMATMNGTELKLCKNFSMESLELSGPERMRVRPAAELFSNRMAALAWKVYPQKPAIGNFFKLVNNSFDVLNSRYARDARNTFRSGFGLYKEDQLEALDVMKEAMKILKFRTPKGNLRSSLLPCQQGFIISINSVIGLLDTVNSLYNVTYILTSNLNQDSLEGFFSRIRGTGSPNSHPTGPEFRYRVKLVMLSSNSNAPQGCNVEGDEGNYISKRLLDVRNPGGSKEDIDESVQNEVASVQVTRRSMRVSFSEVDEESLLYLAGYISWKLQKKGHTGYGTQSRLCNLGANFSEKTWLGILSRGGLMVPNDSVQDTVRSCEIEFRNVIDMFATSKYCEKKLYYFICRAHPEIDRSIVAEFVRVRLRIRIKYMNQIRRNKSRVKSTKLKQFVKSKK